MTTALTITGCLQTLAKALTPLEKLKAARSFNSDPVADKLFILVGIGALIVLIALFLAVTFRRKKQERRSSDQMFLEFARKRGLSTRECQILIKAAQKTGLKRRESIFTLSTAFERGTAKMLEEIQADPQAVEESSQLRMEIDFLREKLGFKQKSPSGARNAGTPKLSSRQIPVGKKIHITRRKAVTSGNIEATVVVNSDKELGIRLAEPIRICFGETWCARYYFGSSVWEFDTSVMSFDGDVLVLSHSEDVRFINRRRFLRVPVKLSAYIACFPFDKLAAEIAPADDEQEQPENEDSKQTRTYIWGPPEFLPAIVTELAGPGLRIESSLDVKIGDRVLVVFSLSQEKVSIKANSSNNKTEIPRIIEGVGEVRHIRPLQDCVSIAVELMDLSDSNTDELIRATNEALVYNSNSKKSARGSEDTAKRDAGALNV